MVSNVHGCRVWAIFEWMRIYDEHTDTYRCFSGKFSRVHICAYVRRSIFSECHRIICICISFIHFVRITGKRLAREGMPLEGLQQVQYAVGLLLHKQLGLMDHLYLLPVFPRTCLENEDGQQKEPYLK